MARWIDWMDRWIAKHSIAAAAAYTQQPVSWTWDQSDSISMSCEVVKSMKVARKTGRWQWCAEGNHRGE